MYPAWNRTFLDLQQHVDEVFEELIYRRALRPSQADWRPPVDIHEMPEEFLLEIDLPAVAPELVRIMANERQLTIKGERCMSAVKGAIYARCERHGGEFCRCVDLPRPVDPEKAQAE